MNKKDRKLVQMQSLIRELKNNRKNKKVSRVGNLMKNLDLVLNCFSKVTKKKTYSINSCQYKVKLYFLRVLATKVPFVLLP